MSKAFKHDIRCARPNPSHTYPQKMKGFEMLNDIKIELFEDHKFKNKTGEVKLCVADFDHLGIIVQAIRQAQNDSGIACHFKITAQSLDY